jgi:hypothetical protein
LKEHEGMLDESSILDYRLDKVELITPDIFITEENT